MAGIASGSVAGVSIAALQIATGAATAAQEPYNFPSSGSATFTAPKTGYWKFVLWGPGGVSNAGVSAGASGAYCEYTRLVAKNETVALVIGTINGGGVATTATFADGKVVSAGNASVNVPGVATGGDVNLAGSVGGVTGTNNGTAGLGTGGGRGGLASAGAAGGGGAPANAPYSGGRGGDIGGGANSNPAIGGGAAEGGANPGFGYAIVAFIRN